uniref:Uncharacterized protein n=1 Tax=Arundo donax TaxID=35708 RepID=A0A0A9T308_ARUDO
MGTREGCPWAPGRGGLGGLKRRRGGGRGGGGRCDSGC